MSYLSATENVGFGGIPQKISDASCATQYKMAANGLEGVTGNCAEDSYSTVHRYIPESSTEDPSYISHINDNFYAKFKIDPNELYTFNDSDVIAGEITVSHTDDTFVYHEDVDDKPEVISSPKKETNITKECTNGDVKEEIKKKVLSNGHYGSLKQTVKDKTHTKPQKAKIQVQEVKKEPAGEMNALSVKSKNVENCMSPPSTANVSSIRNAQTTSIKQPQGVTFLDVFKREQGLVENTNITVKTEPLAPEPLMKAPPSPPKKISLGKTPSSSKQRRGRGPAMHEALQRIPRRAIPVPIKKWHAPSEVCGSMSSKKPKFGTLDSSSSDDDEMPDIEIGSRPLCIEEIAAESRSARLEFRREAMRKRLETANEMLRIAKRHSKAKALCSIVKKQLNSCGQSGLPTQTVNHLLAMRGMPSLFTSEERRKLRESGWSGGESGSSVITEICSEDTCSKPSLPCGRYCLTHITLAPEQRLFASCAAVFAVGSRCNFPLLPLKDQLPLCTEHAWKRDNYDKLIRDNRPRKVIRPRMLSTPRRPKRRRRPPPLRSRPGPSSLPPPQPALPPPPALSQSLSEINTCSNSSAYDSSEDPMGVLSENEYGSASYPHELEVEVVHDILDPSVLSQMPDEAFTEFLNQEESGTFGESSELAAALEAVLDERDLDERDLDERELDETELDETELEETELDNGELEETVLEDETLHAMDHSMFVDSPDTSVEKIKMEIPASVSMELSSSASS